MDMILPYRVMDMVRGTKFNPSKGTFYAVSVPIEGDKVREFRVSGKPKTWKTRPNDVKVPIKYGLYKNAYLGTVDGCEPLERFYLTREEAEIEVAPKLKGKIGTKKQRLALDKLIEA